MTKALVFNGKYDQTVFDVSSDNLMRGAFRDIFERFSEYYDESQMNSRMLELYRKACDGDFESLKKFLYSRRYDHYEYEDDWYIEDVISMEASNDH